MTKSLKQEIEEAIAGQSLNCSIDKFAQKTNWYSVSISRNLSVEFIEYFIDNINWVAFKENKRIPENIKLLFSHNYE